jgi:Raf kinase inhibitor-like YbhB/YbcL family protein
VVRVKTFIILAIGGLVIAFGYVVFAIFVHTHTYAYQQLLVSSDAFVTEQEVPSAYTCNGTDVNPELLIQNIPDGAQSVAVDLVDTSNASNQANWLMWNISPEVTAIPEHANASVGQIGVNAAGKNAYSGPCAPSGTRHYHYEAYALDTILDLPATANYADMQQAMKTHIVAYGSLTGLYVSGK